MRLLSLLVRIAVFLLVLMFALANTQSVTVTLLPGVAGLAFNAPMVLWLLGVFALGALTALLFMLPTLARKMRAPKQDAAAGDRRDAWHQGMDTGAR